MNVVVDANIIIAALLGSRGVIALITSQNYHYYSPKKIIDELKRKKKFIIQRIGQAEEEFDINLNAILVFIKIVDSIEYRDFLDDAIRMIGDRDSNDIDFLACALYVNAGFIWTEDKDFIEQKLIPIKNTDKFIEDGRKS